MSIIFLRFLELRVVITYYFFIFSYHFQYNKIGVSSSDVVALMWMQHSVKPTGGAVNPNSTCMAHNRDASCIARTSKQGYGE